MFGLWLLSGAELYSMYVGEGEALLRNTFQRARLAAPSIIFFDEADVVAAKRLVYIFIFNQDSFVACLDILKELTSGFDINVKFASTKQCQGVLCSVQDSKLMKTTNLCICDWLSRIQEPC